MNYKCVAIGEVLHAAQTQARLAGVNCDGRVRHAGWTLGCCVWAEGKLVDGRPDCPDCLRACELHDRLVASGEARELPAMGAARVVREWSGGTIEMVEGYADRVSEALTAHDGEAAAQLEQAQAVVVVKPDAASLAREAIEVARAIAKATPNGTSVDVAEDMIERLLIETPAARNQAIVDAVRAAGLKASFGRVDKVRAKVGIAEPAKAPRAPKAPGVSAPSAAVRECTPECLAGGKPCSPECAAELGLKS